MEMLLARRGKNLEQQEKAKEFESSQDKIISEGIYADPQNQALYDEDILSLCHTAILNTWDRIQEQWKIIESYIRVKQGQREHFSYFFTKIN